MNIGLFEKMGIAGFDFSYVFIALIVLIIVLFVLTIILMVKVKNLKYNYRKFMTGKNVRSLEDEIVKLFDDNRQMKEQIYDNKNNIENIYENLKVVYQKSAIIRYDAFKEMGGKLSFCLVMLDKENNGFLLNSVHSSAGCYSYLKEINNGKCEIDLGDEEQKALNVALGAGVAN